MPLVPLRVSRAEFRYRHRRLAWLVVVAAALVGLFAMHGLSDHGVSHGSPSPTTAVSGAPAEHPSHLSESAAAAPQGGGSSDSAPHESGMALMMCLAVLALAGFGLGLLPTRLSWHASRSLRLGAAVGAISVHTARDRDPPCLIRLAIDRC